MRPAEAEIGECGDVITAVGGDRHPDVHHDAGARQCRTVERIEPRFDLCRIDRAEKLILQHLGESVDEVEAVATGRQDVGEGNQVPELVEPVETGQRIGELPETLGDGVGRCVRPRHTCAERNGHDDRRRQHERRRRHHQLPEEPPTTNRRATIRRPVPHHHSPPSCRRGALRALAPSLSNNLRGI